MWINFTPWGKGLAPPGLPGCVGGSLIEIRCLLTVEVLLQEGRGATPIRSMFHIYSNKPLGQGRARDTGCIPLLPTREHEQFLPFRKYGR